MATATSDEKNYNGELVCVGRTRDNTTCKPKGAAMNQMNCYPGKSPEQMYPGKSGPPGPPGPAGKGGDNQFGGWTGYDNYPYGSYKDPSWGSYGSAAQSYPYGGGQGQMGGGRQMGGFNSSPYAAGAGKMAGNARPGYNNFSYTRRW